MTTTEIPLSRQLLGEAQSFSRRAHQKNLADRGTFNRAAQEIGEMLAQLPEPAAQAEYLRIQTGAIQLASQITSEKGPAAAAQFLLGHAAAASVLENMLQLTATRPNEKDIAQLILKNNVAKRINRFSK